MADLETDLVMGKIESIVMECVKSIMAGEGFSFTIPTRSESNQLYVPGLACRTFFARPTHQLPFLPALDRIVLKDKKSKRAFVNFSQCRKTAIMTRVLSLIYEVLKKRIHITKRDLFYTDVKVHP